MRIDTYISREIELLCSHIVPPEGTEERIRKQTISKLMHRSYRVRSRLYSICRYAAVVVSVLTVGAGAFYLGTTNPIDDKSLASMIITVPMGAKSAVTLPDGTKVWLNAGSKLSYPVGFSSRNRSVTLKGEAFFDVVKNEKAPFVVSTKEFDITVLGTKFNVKAYEEEASHQVMLVEGSVRLETDEVTKILKPYEQAEFIQGDFKISKVNNANQCISWKDGRLVFKSRTLAEIATMMERWYGIRIIIKDSDLASEKVTGEFSNENVGLAIEYLKSVLSFRYETYGDTFVIY